MRVLVADKFEQSGRDGLEAIGCEVSFQPDLKDEALVNAIAEVAPDVLVVRGTKVTEPMLAAGPRKGTTSALSGGRTSAGLRSGAGAAAALVSARAPRPSPSVSTAVAAFAPFPDVCTAAAL